MATGTVNWFSPTKGYGFIQHTEVGDAAPQQSREGQMMSYEERKTEAKRQEKSAGSAFARAVSGTTGSGPAYG